MRLNALWAEKSDFVRGCSGAEGSEGSGGVKITCELRVPPQVFMRRELKWCQCIIQHLDGGGVGGTRWQAIRKWYGQLEQRVWMVGVCVDSGSALDSTEYEQTKGLRCIKVLLVTSRACLCAFFHAALLETCFVHGHRNLGPIAVYGLEQKLHRVGGLLSSRQTVQT